MPLNLAYISPLPPAATGIADYSADLLPHLAPLTPLTLISPQPNPLPHLNLPHYHPDQYPSHHPTFNLTLYQMGNSLHHQFMFPLLLRHPGVVMLHDYILHHFIEADSRNQNNPARYAHALGYAHGRPGLTLAHQIARQQLSPPWFDLPLNQPLIDASLALLTHSHYAANKLRAHRPDRPVHVIPQLMAATTVPDHTVAALRAQLPWPADALILASAGQVTRTKQLDLALRAFARLRAHHPNLYYLIIGAPNPQELDLDTLLTDLDLHGAVHLTGFVADLNTFSHWFHVADIIINLRYPTVGETSATALRALAAGKPLVVYDHGWYAELPATIAHKISPQDEAALYQTLHTLITQPAHRHTLATAAQTHIRHHHHPATIARQTVDTLNLIYTQLLT